ncbi:hypothetical protein DFH07DRAFT_801772 [Mycena maculata]|uniref:Uncharacterized protein n=1 Tax=Mycena maculata TaxID=230809 RepID=A0AAD7JY02_9AGAR|nr:hypothetical protein DFH07DRAFT_801772 [Mycena maculata]
MRARTQRENLLHLRLIAPFTRLSPVVAPLTILNNNVTYPRRSPTALSPEKAREYIDRLHAIRDTAFSPPDEWMNKESGERLLQYLARAEAGELLPHPHIVLVSWHFLSAAYDPDSACGEAIWMRPILKLLKDHDVFLIYAGFPEKAFQKAFKLLGNDLVSHAWMDEGHLIHCFRDPQHCIQSPLNPDGIPLWKMFAFTFWGSLPVDISGQWRPESGTSWSFNPLGREWNLVPYQMPEGHFYIGYHYERCDSLQYVPFAERPDQIVILAKKSKYLRANNGLLFDPSNFYTRLKNGTGYDILTNAHEDEGYPIPDGLTSVGLLPQVEYDHQLANTKALLCIGKPQISPTPYASLCRGVPVVIPYRSGKCSPRPGPGQYCGFYEDSHQHGPVAAIGEPYAYTVDLDGPVDDIITTIEQAANTPIEPFEPEEMKIDAVRMRLLDYFEIDWEVYGRAKGFETREMVLMPGLIEWTERNALD